MKERTEPCMDKALNLKEAYVFSTLATISVKTEQMDFTQNSLIVVTSAGVIHGTYVSDQMKETLQNDLTYLTFENIGTLATESYSGTQKAILLKNAALTTSQGVKSLFNYLYVFVEDILALYYGNIAYN